MKCIPAAIFSMILLFTSAALAQCPAPPPASTLAEGQIGLFYDALGTQTCGSPTGFASLYLVARVPAGGIKEFLFPQLGWVSGPKPISYSMSLPPGGPFSLGGAFDYCASAYRSNPQTCPVAQGDLLVIAKYDLIGFSGSGIACFQTTCPTWMGLLAVPVSCMHCDGSTGTFVASQSLCVGLGEAPVALEPITWGAVKAIYR